MSDQKVILDTMKPDFELPEKDVASDNQSKWTIPQASYSLTKSAMGAGTLFMPVVFYRLGWAAASISLVTAMLASLWSIYFLHNACYRTRTTDYMTLASSLGDWRLQIPTAICVSLVTMAPMIVSIRLTAAYIGSVASYFSNGATNLNPRVLEVALSLLALLPMSMIRDTKSVARFSIIGMLAMLYVVMLTFMDLVFSDRADSPSVLAVNMETPLKTMFGCFATLLFSFSCHFTVPLLWKNLDQPCSSRSSTVLICSCAFTAVLYLTTGLSGSLQFGALTPGDILNARPSNKYYIIGQAMIASNNILSFPLQLLPIRGMASWFLSRCFPSNPKSGPILKDTILHSVLVGAAALTLALGISSLFKSTGTVFDVIGSVCGGPVALIFPSVFFYMSHPKSSLLTRSILLILIALGTVFVVGGFWLIFA